MATFPVLMMQANPGKGYLIGYGGSSQFAYPFATMTRYALTAALQGNADNLGGGHSATKGYWADTANDTKVYGLIFSTETNAGVSATVASGRDTYKSCFVNSFPKMYQCGGGDGMSQTYSYILGFTFDTESGGQIAATLNDEVEASNPFASTSRGYISGGAFWGGSVNSCTKLTFATQTTAPVVNLFDPVGRSYAASFNSRSRGYVLGGRKDSVNRSDIIGLRFDTESALTISATLHVAMSGVGAFSTETCGLSTENGNGSTGWLGEFNYATETNAVRWVSYAAASNRAATFHSGNMP